MKIVGLITEYNPFHNGHQYHIQKAKEITGANYCIVVMSGDFVQRGAPAFMPKHLRSRMALLSGADLVLELPVCYSCGSAEYFSRGAVALLNSLGCVDSLCFGSECGDYDALEKIAKVLSDEPLLYKEALQTNLKSGLSYPAARQNALKTYFNDKKTDQLLDEPNNILGIEYIKALYNLNSTIKGYTIQRNISCYHEKELNENFSSASAIRNIISETDAGPDFDKLISQMPAHCLDIIKQYHGFRYPVFANDLSLILKYKLLLETNRTLISYQDITPDLANRIINFRNDFQSFEQFCNLLKTKETTYSRISRCLIHILLNIRSEDLTTYKNDCDCYYAKVLGFRKSSAEIFKALKETTAVPIITKLTQTDELSLNAKRMLDQDIFCSDLYESIVSHKFNVDFINEFQKQIVKI